MHASVVGEGEVASIEILPEYSRRVFLHATNDLKACDINPNPTAQEAHRAFFDIRADSTAGYLLRLFLVLVLFSLTHSGWCRCLATPLSAALSAADQLPLQATTLL